MSLRNIIGVGETQTYKRENYALIVIVYWTQTALDLSSYQVLFAGHTALSWESFRFIRSCATFSHPYSAEVRYLINIGSCMSGRFVLNLLNSSYNMT